jgi:integrase
MYRNHLQSLAAMRVSTVTKAVVSRILADAEKRSLSGATLNNIRALVSSVFGRAIEWGYVTTNPVPGIKMRAKVKRDRFLQADELPRFFQSLADEPNVAMRDCILLALLTGARRANLLAMRWSDVALEESIWHIPRTKNGSPQNVALCPEAVAILVERKEKADPGGIFVFPGTGRTGHITSPKKAVTRVMERAGIPYGRDVENGVTFHDLRRTLGSWQAKTGVSLVVIGKSLGHASPLTTAIYARLDIDPVRASVNTATAAMLEAAGVKPRAEVVEIGAKRRG